MAPLLRAVEAFGFEPLRLLRTLRAWPYFVGNARRYRAAAAQEGKFELKLRNLYFTTADRFSAAGNVSGHYFWQDLWAADWLYRQGVRQHVDVASRLDGFVAHLLPFCEVSYVDLRPLELEWPTFHYVAGSLVELPFADASVASLSCLHVLEHIGLGRYGDPVEPGGYRRAARELARVLAPGGHLLFATPVGRERVHFDAHRVFDPVTVEDIFQPLKVAEFHLIPDRGDRIIFNADRAAAGQCEYGCGLYVFRNGPAGGAPTAGRTGS